MNIPNELKDMDKMFTKQQQNMFIIISLIIFLSGSFYLGYTIGENNSGYETKYNELVGEYNDLVQNKGYVLDINLSRLSEEVKQNEEQEQGIE